MDIIGLFFIWILYSISGFYFFKLTTCFLPLKENILIKPITYIGMILIVNVVIFSNDITNISYMMVSFLLLVLLFYKGNIFQKISIVMVLYPITVALNFITNDIASKIHFIGNPPLFIDNILEHMSVALCCVFWLGLYKISCTRIEKSCKLINKKTWILIDIMCLAPLISIYFAIINTPIGEEFKIYFTSIACIITNVGMIFLIEYITKSVKTKIENQNLKLQYNYYKELEANQLEIRKLRHDMSNHLSIIYSFLESENINSAKEYFSSLSDKFKVTSRQFCKNSIVNAVLNAKYNLAIENKIDCFFNIDINNIIPISDVDLCSIFANTLDNAIEASEKISETSQRKITLKARCHKGYFSYNITNNYFCEVNFINGKYITNKSNSKLHGLGVENIKDIVEKYDGTFNITYTDTEFSIIIVIKIT